MRNDDLELVASKESARANAYDERARNPSKEIVDLPSVLPMTERHVFRRRAHELMLDPLALICAHVREPERVEDARIIVVVVVPVCRGCSSADHRSGGYHGPVGERDVHNRLADDRDCALLACQDRLR